jgi:hypothetical protein
MSRESAHLRSNKIMGKNGQQAKKEKKQKGYVFPAPLSPLTKMDWLVPNTSKQKVFTANNKNKK